MPLIVVIETDITEPRLDIYGEVNSAKNATINMWINDGVY